jgi:hypothetical protein
VYIMKSFTEFLTESKKVYPFKIGIAGELPEGCKEQLETSLKKFDIKSMSAGKATPIQERPLDFPQLKNETVTYWDIEFSYPTTVQVLQQYIGECCGIDQAYIIVRNPNEPQELYQTPEDNTPYETMLTKEDLGGVSAQGDVGESRVMDLLKELEKVRKEREHDPSAVAPETK